jgi:hypothetical protein
MKFSKMLLFASLFSLCLLTFNCTKTEETTPTPATPITSVPEVYKKIYGASSITLDGSFITIKSNGNPDHKSIYFATSNALYETFSGTTFGGFTFKKNPNAITTYNYVFKIPVSPQVADNHKATPLGAIGVALNGIPLYNQYAGPNNLALTNEFMSFDKYNGHPTGNGNYHYHVEPSYLTTVKTTKSGLLGFLLDGFPVYGPQDENGKTLVNSDLDVYHGHSHVTVDYPKGIYHYHFTAGAPFLNGNGYYGTPGTVTQ